MSSVVTMRITSDEPEGSMEHVIRPMVLSLENMRRFWAEARKHRTLFGEEISDDFQKFINKLVVDGPDGITPTGLFWVIDDFVGVFYLTDIELEFDALVHYAFFDGRLRGRIQMARAMTRFVFRKYKFVRLSAQIPLYASSAVFRFVEEVGFKLEGRKRNAAEYRGKYFDVNLFGILREEAMNNEAD